MSNFWRSIRLALRYKSTLFASIFCALMVAVLWGGNIGAVYPFVEVIYKGESLPKWTERHIVGMQQTIAGLDARLAEGWDASVILLGNNYRGNRNVYRDELDRMVTRLSPNPVVLLTVTEWDPSRVIVNEVILDVAASHDNVTIVDWANTTAENEKFTGFDHLHLTMAGRRALAEDVALALGPAPKVPGDCLETTFLDDSSGGVLGTTTTAAG